MCTFAMTQVRSLEKSKSSKLDLDAASPEIGGQRLHSEKYLTCAILWDLLSIVVSRTVCVFQDDKALMQYLGQTK